VNPSAVVPLRDTGLEVTRIGLGTTGVGGLFEAVSEDDARETIEEACERGVRFFDTAPLYGMGLAERRLGETLATRPRGEFVLATKVGRLLRPGAPPEPGQEAWTARSELNPVFDFSADAVLRSVDESLARLGLDRIDVLHVHDPDEHYETALTGAYPALDRLRAEGAIGAVGAGMNQAEMLVRFAREADFDCFLVAGRYTLLDQSALVELLPICLERGIAVVIGGVYNSGILADPSAGATFDYRPATPERIVQARRLQAVCERHGVPLPAAALQFPFAHPAVTSVLVGARSPDELDASLAFVSMPIPDDLWAELRSEGLLPQEAPVP
jgi:D-threo-aldose 1-dehydrogenase